MKKMWSAFVMAGVVATEVCPSVYVKCTPSGLALGAGSGVLAAAAVAMDPRFAGVSGEGWLVGSACVLGASALSQDIVDQVSRSEQVETAATLIGVGLVGVGLWQGKVPLWAKGGLATYLIVRAVQPR